MPVKGIMATHRYIVDQGKVIRRRQIQPQGKLPSWLTVAVIFLLNDCDGLGSKMQWSRNVFNLVVSMGITGSFGEAYWNNLLVGRKVFPKNVGWYGGYCCHQE